MRRGTAGVGAGGDGAGDGERLEDQQGCDGTDDGHHGCLFLLPRVTRGAHVARTSAQARWRWWGVRARCRARDGMVSRIGGGVAPALGGAARMDTRGGDPRWGVGAPPLAGAPGMAPRRAGHGALHPVVYLFLHSSLLIYVTKDQ